MITALTLDDARYIRAEIVARYQECGDAARLFQSFLAEAVVSVRRGRPTSGIVEEAVTLLGYIEEAAGRLMETITLATDRYKASTSEVEALYDAFEPTSGSMKQLISRAKLAKAAGKSDDLKAALEELAPLRLTFEKYECESREYKQIRSELDPMRTTLEEFRVMNASSLWDSDLDELRKLATPPAIATFLLAALSKPTLRVGTIGDAEEEFNKNLDSHGRYWAVALYWADTLRSVGPLLVRFIGRVITAYLIASR
jgi:hypothetical protein